MGLNPMNYAQSLDYLKLLAERGIKSGLEHTLAIARALSDPQESFPSILVAGTNGKGSVSATLASILSRSGRRTGLYTSPHLVDVRERVRVDGRWISKARFSGELAVVRRLAEEAVESKTVEDLPTHFEALTLLAFRHFQREGVEVAVLEVGLGGRWDCTNIVEPVLSVITSIARDHEEWLGLGLRNIAREKAGVLRARVPAVTSATRPEALEVLQKVARQLGTPLNLSSECTVTREEDSWHMECPEGRLETLPYPTLAGGHQLENAALACRAALVLRSLGWEISDGAVREGLQATRWLGRIQKVREGPAVYLDGAHNVEGCEALRRFADGLPGPRVLVFAAMKDKPMGDMATALFPAFDAVVATQVPMERCAAATAVPLENGSWEGFAEVDPAAAVERAARIAGPGGSVVVAGSLYLVGHLLSVWGMGEETP
jgi:dihydrofolate synthase/folylpolyglutamate synthase